MRARDDPQAYASQNGDERGAGGVPAHLDGNYPGGVCVDANFVEGLAMSDKTLSWEEFMDQCEECNLGVGQPGDLPYMNQVVIRGLDGDYGLAAVHRDGDRLIFDLGHKLED